MKCKTSYVKVNRLKLIGRKLDYVGHAFEASSHSYIRNIKTAQEIRRNLHDELDAKEERLPIKTRRSRCGYSLSSWNLERLASMTHKKSWKRFYRIRKQWLVNV